MGDEQSARGRRGIVNRTRQLVADSEREVILVVGDETAFDDDLVARLREAHHAGVTVVLGAGTPAIREHVRAALPEIDVTVSDVTWLAPSDAGDETRISRPLLVDHEAILVGSIAADREERAVSGRGFDNELVAIVRRLMGTGLLVDGPSAGTEED